MGAQGQATGSGFVDAATLWKLRARSMLAVVLAWIWANAGFTIVVVIPTFAAATYYGLIAADIYTSSAQFVVKSANENSALSGLGAFLQSTGVANAPSDAYTVDAYLTSRDALAALEKKPGIRAIYDRPEADFLTRFPNIFYGSSFENLFLHYSDWINVDFDSTSNITTLTVYAFRPLDAQSVAARLLTLGEVEVNRLNDRVRDDALRGAHREVNQLQARALDIQNQITTFRDKHLLLNPSQTSTASVSLLAALEADLVSTRASLAQIQKSAPNSPQIPTLEDRIVALQKQVLAEEERTAGGPTSLAPKLAQYEQLLLKQQFVQQMLQSAVTSLEAAEATVQQQQIYLARISQPSRPDLALYPHRLIDTLVVLVTSLLIYWIGRMIVGTVAAHIESRRV